MSQYNIANVKLSDSKLYKLKIVTLRLSINIKSNAKKETSFPH